MKRKNKVNRIMHNRNLKKVGIILIILGIFIPIISYFLAEPSIQGLTTMVAFIRSGILYEYNLSDLEIVLLQNGSDRTTLQLRHIIISGLSISCIGIFFIVFSKSSKNNLQELNPNSNTPFDINGKKIVNVKYAKNIGEPVNPIILIFDDNTKLKVYLHIPGHDDEERIRILFHKIEKNSFYDEQVKDQWMELQRLLKKYCITI